MLPRANRDALATKRTGFKGPEGLGADRRDLKDPEDP